MIQIYHNARCGKSRACVTHFSDLGNDFEIIKYLENPPTHEELTLLLQKLNQKPIELVRKKETIWIEKFKQKTLTDSEIIQAMVDYPILIERPIVINGNKAVIARPLENVLSVI